MYLLATEFELFSGALKRTRSRVRSAGLFPGQSGVAGCDVSAEGVEPADQEAPAHPCSPANSPALHGGLQCVKRIKMFQYFTTL